MEKTTMRVAFGTLLLLLANLAAPCLAAPVDKTPNDKSLILSKIDPDNDGTLSLDEAKKAAAAAFEDLDTDKEGTLDATELTGIVSPATLAKADTDKDGTLDKAEYITLVAKAFAAADPDKDGTLDAKELSTEKGRALVALISY
jgi:hypothetical protein